MSPRSTTIAIASSSAEATAPAPGIRAWVRLIALASGAFLWISLWAVATLLAFPVAPARRAVRRWVFRHWARFVAWVLGLRTVVEGTVPPVPFFLVSNHLSYLDIVVYAATAPARFVAKQEVRGWAGIGALARSMGTIFVDRTVKRDALRALDWVAAALAEGDGVIVFAEATSTPGQTVLPFRPALLEWAARTGQPVHYASLSYRTAAPASAARSVCWWGDMTFGPHLLEMCSLPWIEATLRFGPAPIEDGDRKRLAGRLHQAVTAQFTPVGME